MDDYKYLNLGSFFLVKSRADKTVLGSLVSVSVDTYRYSKSPILGFTIQGNTGTSYITESIQDIIPISINKEILEVSEFIFQDNIYSKNEICISPTNDNRWDVTISTETSNVHTCISYVHELQSLYLMFFNEQLPLKFGDLRLILENGNSQSSN